MYQWQFWQTSLKRGFILETCQLASTFFLFFKANVQSERCQSHCSCHTSPFIHSIRTVVRKEFSCHQQLKRSVAFLVCCTRKGIIALFFGDLRTITKRYSFTKGNYPETTLTRRTNAPQSAYSEAKPICIQIKDVQRLRCVPLSTQSVCSRKDNRASPRMETSEHSAHFQSECLKWEVNRDTYDESQRQRTFLVIFFFFLEVLQDNMITAQGLKEKIYRGIDTK